MDQSESDAPLWRRLLFDEAWISLIASGTQPYAPHNFRTCDSWACYAIPLLDVVRFDPFGSGTAERLSGVRGASYIRLLTGMCESAAAAVRLRQNDVDRRGATATWHCLSMAVAVRVCPFGAETARG